MFIIKLFIIKLFNIIRLHVRTETVILCIVNSVFCVYTFFILFLCQNCQMLNNYSK